ncbi:MAG: hypothetical protein ACLTMP_02580 [Eggerthella lenta]
MGVVELRCTATVALSGHHARCGEGAQNLRAKLNRRAPNRPLQQLWSEHGENGFDFHVADTLEYENPKTSRPTTCKPYATCCWPKTPKPARSGSEPGASVDP